MKVPGLLLLIFSLMLLAQCRNAENKLPEKGICAHRGEHEVNPENTIPAFKAAVEMGAHMIEFDVRLTKDKKPVVMHDRTVDRTTDGSGAVSDLMFKEIRELDAGIKKGEQFKGVKVPDLSEALDVMPDNIWLNVHLKGSKELGRVVAQVIKDKGRMKQSVIACNSVVLEGVREVGDDFLICNMERQSHRKEYVDATIEGRFPFIQLLVKRKDDSLKEDVKRLKENHVKVNFYHAETAEEVKELFDIGVDFILTNNLDEMIKYAESLGIERRK